MGFGTRNDEAVTTIFPFVAAGFAGSNVTVPEIPLALPLMASSGASSLNTALFTLLGSLKSNVCGAANTAQVAAPTINRMAMDFFIHLRFKRDGLELVFCGTPGKRRPGFLLPATPRPENRAPAGNVSHT